MEGTFQRRFVPWTCRFSSWDLQEEAFCSPPFIREISGWWISLQRGTFLSSCTASNSWNALDGFHGLFFLLVWIIHEHFAMATGRRSVAAARVNLNVVRWSQQASLKCAMMSHAEAGQYEIIICLQHGLCFVLFCLAKGETTQKVNSLRLILKVLWKTREILTRKKRK